MFGLFKKKTPAELLARTITNYAVNPAGCLQMAAMMRGYRVDDEVLLSELSMLRVSYVRGLFRRQCSSRVYPRMAETAEKTVLETFKSTQSFHSPGVRDFYDGRPLTEVVKGRLEAYAAKEDLPEQTCPLFCTRVKAPGIVSNVEVQRMLDDFLGIYVQKALTAVRAV